MKLHSSDLRRQCAAHKQRESCYICGKHKDITEAHHVLPLKDVAFLLSGWGELEEPPIVWLCPNYHTYVHRPCAITPCDSVSDEILQKTFELQAMGLNYLDQHLKTRLLQALKEDSADE